MIATLQPSDAQKLTLEELLQKVGWPLPRQPRLQHMRAAYQYFHTHCGPQCFDIVGVESPWVHPRPPMNRKPKHETYRIVTWLQAIDFDAPVCPVVLPPGYALRRYVPVGTPPSRYCTGRWWTDPHSLSGLALPPGSYTWNDFRVTRPLSTLRSQIADAFTWSPEVEFSKQRRDFGQDYLRGGAQQFFILNAKQYVDCKS